MPDVRAQLHRLGARAAGDQVGGEDLPRTEMARQQDVQLPHDAEADDQHRGAATRPARSSDFTTQASGSVSAPSSSETCSRQTQRVTGSD